MCACLACGCACAVVDIVVGEAEHLIAFVVGVDVHASSAAHVIHARQIPFLDSFACCRVVDDLPEEVALLDGVALHSRPVGVDVGKNPAVSVSDTRAMERAFHRVDRISSLTHLIESVAIDICHPQLMELRRPGPFVVSAPCRAVVPVGGCAVVPVVFPGEHIVVVVLVGTSVQALHDQCRVYAIDIADGEMPVEHGVTETHVFGTAVAGVGVVSVMYLAVVQLAAVDFRTSLSVNDRDVEGRQFGCLRAVVDDSVVVGVTAVVSVGVFAPCVVGFVPEACAVGAFDDDLAFAVAVDVVSHHHVVLPAADVDVRPHIHGP